MVRGVVRNLDSLNCTDHWQRRKGRHTIDFHLRVRSTHGKESIIKFNLCVASTLGVDIVATRR